MTFASITEMFHHAARRFPAHTAVERGSRLTTFAEIAARSTRLAGILREGGAQPGQAAALLIEDTASLAVAMLAALEARCLFVPFDVGLPDRRLAALLTEIEPRWILVEPGPAAGRLSRLETSMEAATVVSVDGAAGPESAGDRRPPPSPAGPDDRSYVF